MATSRVTSLAAGLPLAINRLKASTICLWILIALIRLELCSAVPVDSGNVSASQSPLTRHKRAECHDNCDTPDGEHIEQLELIGFQWHEMRTLFLYTLFLIIAGLLKIAYHHSYWLSHHLPESCVLILLGIMVGVTAEYTDVKRITPKFSNKLFFYGLLPPIILESAYSLNDRTFYSNLPTILTYAIIGTLMNIFLIGPSLYACGFLGLFGGTKVSLIENLCFSTLISAVDPVAVLAIFQEIGVNKSLYFLVFGESLLNDAVVIVVFAMMTHFAQVPKVLWTDIVRGVIRFLTVSFVGLAIGAIFGFITALVTKTTEHVRVVEPLMILGMAYLSFITAEVFHLSGIISLIACGIIQTEYARYNVSNKSYTTVQYFVKTASSICDVIIFLFLGMLLINDRHVWNTGYTIAATVFIIVFRFMSVFSLTYIANHYYQRVRLINLEEQFVMAYGGLRGAIAFALVASLKDLDHGAIANENMLTTTTLFIILFTVFVLGSTTKPVVRLLQIQTHHEHEPSIFHEICDKVIESTMVGIEEITGNKTAQSYWTKRFAKFNKKYLRRWFINPRALHHLQLTYNQLMQSNVTMDNHKLKGTSHENLIGETKEGLRSRKRGSLSSANRIAAITPTVFADKETIGLNANGLPMGPIAGMNRGKQLWGRLRPEAETTASKALFNRSVTANAPGDKPLDDDEKIRRTLKLAFKKSAFFSLPSDAKDPRKKMTREALRNRWIAAAARSQQSQSIDSRSPDLVGAPPSPNALVIANARATPSPNLAALREDSGSFNHPNAPPQGQVQNISLARRRSTLTRQEIESVTLNYSSDSSDTDSSDDMDENAKIKRSDK